MHVQIKHSLAHLQDLIPTLAGNLDLFLNQAYAGRRPVPTCFLKIVSVWTSACVCVYVCVFVCVCLCVSAPRLLIISGVMWHDMDPIRLWTPYDC